jgi:hypothetical protein
VIGPSNPTEAVHDLLVLAAVLVALLLLLDELLLPQPAAISAVSATAGKMMRGFTW